jgi:hypothetical protein
LQLFHSKTNWRRKIKCFFHIFQASPSRHRGYTNTYQHSSQGVVPMTNLIASEPSLLDGKRNSSRWGFRLWARLMNISATADSSLQRGSHRIIDRAFDHNLHNQLRHEVMRHEARRLL